MRRLTGPRTASLGLTLTDDRKDQRLLTLDAADFRAIGFSGRKVEYVRSLAEHIISGELQVDHLDKLTDEELRSIAGVSLFKKSFSDQVMRGAKALAVAALQVERLRAGALRSTGNPKKKPSK